MQAQRTATRARRLPAALIGLVVAGVMLLAMAAPALADEAMEITTVAPSLWPNTVTVGQNIPLRVQLKNTSTGNPALAASTVTSLVFWPACGVNISPASSGCPVASGDPGVFTVSSTASGATAADATACTGINFTITVIDAATGEVRFTPTAPIVLAIPLSGPGDTCDLDLSLHVNALPTKPWLGIAPPLRTENDFYGQITNNVSNIQGDGAGTDLAQFPLPTSIVTTDSTAALALGAGTVFDSATLSGGDVPTGTITFSVYGPNDSTCSNPPVHTSVVNVNGDKTYSSDTFTPTVAGTYRFVAAYSGDMFGGLRSSLPSTTTCGDVGETVVVSPTTPTITTTASAAVNLGAPIADSAVLSGGVNPTGRITFSVYGPNDTSCSSPAVFTSSATVSAGNGTYLSGLFTPTAAGTYRFVAAYNGDANNSPVTTACSDPAESVVVSRPPPGSPAIVTTASAAVNLGNPISDSATLTGGSSPTGTVTFNIYGPNNATCTGGAISTSSATLSAAGTATSAAFTPTQVGTYRFVAVYSGDANNASVTSACNAAAESVVVSPLTPTLTTQASPAITLGGRIFDTATLAGGSSPTGTITFKIYGPNDATCTGSAADTATVTVSKGDGDYPSALFSPSVAGTYRFVATYSGDANNNAVSTACSDAKEAVVVSPKPSGGVKGNTTPVKPSKPPVPAVPQGTASLHGPPAGCVPKTFKVYVAGTHIKNVMYTINGKPAGTVTKPTGGRYTVMVDASKLAHGSYHVAAKVMFTNGKTKTVTLTFDVCKQKIKPKFTG